MIGGGEVQDLSAGVVDDEKAIELPAGGVEHGEKIHGANALLQSAGQLFPGELNLSVFFRRWKIATQIEGDS